MDEVQHDADDLFVGPVMRALGALDRENRRFRARYAAEFGFGSNELIALLAVGRTGSATPKAVAEEVGLTSGSVTALLDRLEASGHIHRVPNPCDRRSVLLQTTPLGEAARLWVRDNLASAIRSAMPAPEVLCTLPLPELIVAISSTMHAATCIADGYDCGTVATATPEVSGELVVSA